MLRCHPLCSSLHWKFEDSHCCFCPAQSSKVCRLKTAETQEFPFQDTQAFPQSPGHIRACIGFYKLPDWLLALPAVPTAGAASVKLAPLGPMTDHFFLAGPLGPGHLHTRSWSFRSKNRLAFSQKQNTPVLPVATLLQGGTQTTLATQMPQPRLPGVWLLSEDNSALFTHG